ncbi:hydrolase [Uliginosibacterium sp. H1]|uniref:hydrolase n=1 Tax=Uliginosibacterium sp. H1 TaxID=3114757 RepID=UPI002E17FC07|nr:hydrolase [Uliginosibacterium sp. H1]
MFPSYQSPAWLNGPHFQTIWPLAIKGDMPVMKRRRWDTPDGDFIDVDFLPRRESTPLVVLFHGLEGSSSSHYARALMRLLAMKGWNGAVVHFRGCSGEPNKLPRAYHSGDADEIDWVLRRLIRRYPEVPRHAVGVSLGGNALLCWLGTRRHKAAELISKAAAVSAPVDLTAAGHHLGLGFNKIYTRHFLRSMLRTARHKAGAFPGMFDVERALRSKTLQEFDDAYTAPLHGFSDVSDYWKRASSKQWLPYIALPTLVLNARNDPFLPVECLPGKRDVSGSVMLEQPEHGGHVGFVTGSFPGKLDWLPQRLLNFFEG